MIVRCVSYRFRILLQPGFIPFDPFELSEQTVDILYRGDLSRPAGSRKLFNNEAK